MSHHSVYMCVHTQYILHVKNVVFWDVDSVWLGIGRPVFRYFMPLGPRNFCPPPHLVVFSYVQLSNSLSSF